MRVSLRLEVELPILKDLDKDKVLSVKKSAFNKSIKEFKDGVKDLISSGELKVIKDMFPSFDIIVEFENHKLVKKRFLELPIVAIIDYIYSDECVPANNIENKLTVKEMLLKEIEAKITKKKLIITYK